MWLYTPLCMVYTMCISFCTHPALSSFYTQWVISHTLCNLCVFFFLFLHKMSVFLHLVCSFRHFFIALPNKFWFTLFCCKIHFFVIYAFFGVNFILRKFCLCKRNDKYDVCNEEVGIRDETSEYERLHDKKYTLPRVPYPLSRHCVLSINQLLYWNKFQTQTFIWKTRQPH